MAENFSLESLETLLDRVVRVYKGGPESSVGRLVAIKDDHLVVDSDQEGIIYYCTAHIKSICEDLEVGNSYAGSGSTATYNRIIEADDMKDLLRRLKHYEIKVDRGGPESRIGRLLDAEGDYFVLATKEDGLLYYQTHHVKSISVISKDDKKSEEEYPDYAGGENLQELCQNLENHWVQINRGGPEMVEGVLTDISEDAIELVHNKEIYRIATYHVRNISYRDKNAMAEENEGENNKKNDKNDKNSKNSKNSKKTSSSRHKWVRPRSVSKKKRVTVRHSWYNHRGMKTVICKQRVHHY